jgi:hypothetical protein
MLDGELPRRSDGEISRPGISEPYRSHRSDWNASAPADRHLLLWVSIRLGEASARERESSRQSQARLLLVSAAGPSATSFFAGLSFVVLMILKASSPESSEVVRNIASGYLSTAGSFIVLW